MKSKEQWISELALEPHIEGGYFKEIYRSTQTMIENGIERALYSSIYFLLDGTNPSNFHRLTADEVWYFHDGHPLTIHMITQEGQYHTVTLGLDVQNGHLQQYQVAKHTIFGSTVDALDGYALVSCMVAPAFEYQDFELFDRLTLMKQYPQHHEMINRLTKQ